MRLCDSPAFGSEARWTIIYYCDARTTAVQRDNNRPGDLRWRMAFFAPVPAEPEADWVVVEVFHWIFIRLGGYVPANQNEPIR
jgi:hypothetical protein